MSIYNYPLCMSFNCQALPRGFARLNWFSKIIEESIIIFQIFLCCERVTVIALSIRQSKSQLSRRVYESIEVQS